MRQLQISDSVSDVLRRSSADGVLLRLPDEQLDRKLYTDVNKVLEALGGKWDKRQKAHVFGRPVSDVLADALNDGTVTPPSKNGYFPTPASLVERLLELADVQPHHRVLEPSAGQGAIADRLREIVTPSGGLDVVELLPANCEVLRANGYRHVGEGDFLLNSPVWIYDRIVMNPPFEKQADIEHVLHAWQFLRVGGRLVSVMASGVTFREDRKARDFREFLTTHGGYIEDNPAGSFRPSGTDVSTVTVVLNRTSA